MSKQCFAVPGEDNIIDEIRPSTGLSWHYGETLAEIQLRYPGAQVVDSDAFWAAKAARQDAESKVWDEITEDRYWEMLECLPPAGMIGKAFLVGEPMDHHAGNGRPRFTCCNEKDGKFFALSAPITITQFNEMFRGYFKPYQPKTGQPCHCQPGQARDNCPDCEGTGQRIDFAAIRNRKLAVA